MTFKARKTVLHGEIPYIARRDLTYIFKQNFAVEVLKHEYKLLKTGSDEILRKNVDSAHLHHYEILHAKFGKNRTVRFRSSARTDIQVRNTKCDLYCIQIALVLLT